MHFAVVEFNSKSGQIWRHTAAKPNYLAHPVNEIDPTSFGCYVSALQGEHIPLRPMIISSLSPDNSLKRLYRRAYHRYQHRYPQNYSLEYFKNFDALIVVHDLANGHEMTAFARRLKKTYPNIIILGVSTQPHGIIKQRWKEDPSALRDFQSFMEACDVFITIVRSTKHDLQTLTNTPVKYFPQPYPVEFAQKYYQPPASKQQIIYLAGVPERFDIKRGHRLAVKLKAEFPGYEIHVTRIPGMEFDAGHLAGTSYKFMPFLLWQEHLAYLSDVSLVINTDYVRTRGRVQVDCAAVGTPSIGADSDGQRDLFPRLPANQHSSPDTLYQQARQLLSNPEFFEEITKYAFSRLPLYNYQNSARRLTDLIQTISSNKII